MLDIDQSDVDVKDRVFLHRDYSGKFYVVRPFDLHMAELTYRDPILNVMHHVGKNGDGKNVVVVDSKAQGPGTKPMYVHRLFKQCTMRASGATLEKCKKFLYCISVFAIHQYSVLFSWVNSSY